MEKKTEILENIDTRLFDIKGVNCLFISALDSSYKNSILDCILKTNKIWNKRISTSILNNWLRNEFLETHSNEYKGSLKIKYLQQPKRSLKNQIYWIFQTHYYFFRLKQL